MLARFHPHDCLTPADILLQIAANILYNGFLSFSPGIIFTISKGSFTHSDWSMKAHRSGLYNQLTMWSCWTLVELGTFADHRLLTPHIVLCRSSAGFTPCFSLWVSGVNISNDGFRKENSDLHVL